MVRIVLSFILISEVDMENVKNIGKHIETIFVCLVFVFLAGVVLTCMGTKILVEYTGISNGITKRILNNLTIQSEKPDNTWKIKYPFSQNTYEEFEEKANQIKGYVNDYCTVSFPFRDIVNQSVKAYQSKLLHYSLDTNSGSYGNMEYILEPYANLVDFAKFCDDRGTPFLYVQTPSEDGVRYYRGEMEYIVNKNVVEREVLLTDSLTKAGIPVLNVGKETVNKYAYLYDSSGHWFPAEGLMAAELIAQTMNNQYGFCFDLSKYRADDYKNVLDAYPDLSQEILDNCGYEYTLLIPNEVGEYIMTYAESDCRKGSFEEVMLNPKEEWLMEGGAYHDMYRVKNSSIYSIKNKTIGDKQKGKILVIGDSFNWPVSIYLATGVEQIDIIHNASFSGSLRAYIKENNPAAVIVCYNNAEFYETYTEDAFDMR